MFMQVAVLYFLPPFVFFPSSNFPVTVASSHQASQRDYYHTFLFVPRDAIQINQETRWFLIISPTLIIYVFTLFDYTPT